MYFLLLCVLLGLIAAYMPKTWVVVKLLVLAPIVGCALGGFTWSIAAMIWGGLITWAAFGTFLAGGTLLAEVAFLKAD
jgi:hypothetical protein